MAIKRVPLPIQGKLQRNTRLALSDRQVTAVGATGQAGVFAVLYMNRTGTHPTIDFRFFGWNEKKQKNSSTIRGVIFNSLEEALAGAESLIELVRLAREHFGLKDDHELSADPVLREG